MSGPHGQPGGFPQRGRPPQGSPPGYPGHPGAPRPQGHPGPQVSPGPARPPGMRPEITVRRPSPPPPPGIPPRRGKLPWVTGLLVLIVVAGAVGFAGFVSPGLLVRSVFDATSVQEGVEQTLRDSYHLDTVRSVRCPRGQTAEPGRTFDCSASLNGARKSVPVTVRDSSGVYEVGYPK